MGIQLKPKAAIYYRLDYLLNNSKDFLKKVYQMSTAIPVQGKDGSFGIEADTYFEKCAFELNEDFLIANTKEEKDIFSPILVDFLKSNTFNFFNDRQKIDFDKLTIVSNKISFSFYEDEITIKIKAPITHEEMKAFWDIIAPSQKNFIKPPPSLPHIEAYIQRISQDGYVETQADREFFETHFDDFREEHYRKFFPPDYATVPIMKTLKQRKEDLAKNQKRYKELCDLIAKDLKKTDFALVHELGKLERELYPEKALQNDRAQLEDKTFDDALIASGKTLPEILKIKQAKKKLLDLDAQEMELQNQNSEILTHPFLSEFFEEDLLIYKLYKEKGSMKNGEEAYKKHLLAKYLKKKGRNIVFKDTEDFFELCQQYIPYTEFKSSECEDYSAFLNAKDFKRRVREFREKYFLFD